MGDAVGVGFGVAVGVGVGSVMAVGVGVGFGVAVIVGLGVVVGVAVGVGVGVGSGVGGCVGGWRPRSRQQPEVSSPCVVGGGLLRRSQWHAFAQFVLANCLQADLHYFADWVSLTNPQSMAAAFRSSSQPNRTPTSPARYQPPIVDRDRTGL